MADGAGPPQATPRGDAGVQPPPRGRVSNLRLVNDLFASAYLKPQRVLYTQEQQPGGPATDLSWDVVEVYDGVSILLYHRTRRSFIVVRQFRPAVWAAIDRRVKRINPDATASPEVGYTYELCGGLLNKGDKSLEQHAVEEVEEETGYALPPTALQLMFVLREAVGILGNSLHAFYAEVDDSMKVGMGGGCPEESEVINIEEIPAEGVFAFLSDPIRIKSAELMHALLLILCPRPMRDTLCVAYAGLYLPRAPHLVVTDAGEMAAQRPPVTLPATAGTMNRRAATAAITATTGAGGAPVPPPTQLGAASATLAAQVSRWFHWAGSWAHGGAGAEDSARCDAGAGWGSLVVPVVGLVAASFVAGWLAAEAKNQLLRWSSVGRWLWGWLWPPDTLTVTSASSTAVLVAAVGNRR